MQEIDFIFSILILIMSVVVHEVSHGYVANILGDPTARLEGRLTLNPIKHLDPVGSVVVPTITYFLGGFIFGWARPVPYNQYNLRNQRWGTALVASAGALSNFIIAAIFGLLIRFASDLGVASAAFTSIAGTVVFLNLILGVFNLVPIPPLDGSKVLFAVLPYKWRQVQDFLEQYWLFLVFLLIFFLWQFIFPLVSFLFRILTGINFPI